MKHLTNLILIILIAFLITGCTAPVPEVKQEFPAPGTGDIEKAIVDGKTDLSTESEGKDIDSKVKEFEIKAKQWSFEPSVITINEGDIVKLSISSVDVTHGMRLAEFGVSEILKPGEVVNVEFLANKKGTFSFFCTVPCGSGHGNMRGTLIVK